MIKKNMRRVLKEIRRFRPSAPETRSRTAVRTRAKGQVPYWGRARANKGKKRRAAAPDEHTPTQEREIFTLQNTKGINKK